MDTYPGNIKRKVVFRNMYLNSLVESECCGCTACEQICPRNCIQMRKNEEGFLYPVVNNDKCIKCGLCEKVCPFGNYQKREQGDICYYGWHKDENERSLSTSGAAFIAISEMCKKKGFTHFYGAAYDSNLCVKHIDTFEFENPEMLRGSKYTQSDIGDTYSAVKQNLKKAKRCSFQELLVKLTDLSGIWGNWETRTYFWLRWYATVFPARKRLQNICKRSGVITIRKLSVFDSETKK